MKTTIIPRRLLFGDPTRRAPRISRDGQMLAFLASRDGVSNVWLANLDDFERARPITHDRGRGVHFCAWAHSCSHVIFLQDQSGEENYHIFSAPIDGGTPVDLTPFENIQARLIHSSPKCPTEILVGVNAEDPRWHDVYRIDVASGTSRLVYQNRKFSGFLADDNLELRLAIEHTRDGGYDCFSRSSSEDWRLQFHVGRDDALITRPIAFGPPESSEAYFIDSRERDKAVVARVDIVAGAAVEIAGDPESDVTEFLINPITRSPDAYRAEYLAPKWEALNQVTAGDFEFLLKSKSGEFHIIDRSAGDRHWIVTFLSDRSPPSYYLYDRDLRCVRLLFCGQSELAEADLAGMRPVIIRSRDGRNLVSYITLPLEAERGETGKPVTALPTILLVHGGPWFRDSFGFNPYNSFFANRGYAVLSVNFRGSTGFGKAFLNAGDREWGGKMLDDLIDAVAWAVDQGIADPDRVAIVGSSYGGYAALAALTFASQKFACGVSLFGPPDLEAFLASVPPYWEPVAEMLYARIGDPRTQAGKELLKVRSPLNFVNRIVGPLLVGQGATDVRVRREQSDRLVEALRNDGRTVVYVVYPDEGHGFFQPENRLSFLAITEAFLGKNLGGRAEPFEDDVQSAKMEIPVGSRYIFDEDSS